MIRPQGKHKLNPSTTTTQRPPKSRNKYASNNTTTTINIMITEGIVIPCCSRNYSDYHITKCHHNQRLLDRPSAVTASECLHPATTTTTTIAMTNATSTHLLSEASRISRNLSPLYVILRVVRRLSSRVILASVLPTWGGE